MTSETAQENPCLPGGLIALDQWKTPETSVQKTLRSGLRDILQQLRAGMTPEDQAFESLDDLPALSHAKLGRYAPQPEAGELAGAINECLASLRQGGTHNRQVSFLVAPPFSGIQGALRASGLRVISPPDNLLMAEKDIPGWWDEQLAGDDWVVPELADFWLRHRSGMGLLKEFFARVAMEGAGKGMVGCSSWCWQFWVQYLPELHVAPLTVAPLTDDRLTRWLAFLASGKAGGPLTARMTNDGLYVLPAPEEGCERKYSDFARDLATMARGNRGVAHAIWQRTLRARAEEDTENGDKEEKKDSSANGPSCWVAPLEQLSLPAVPQSNGRQPGHILHALLLHNGLTSEQLQLVTGWPGQEISLSLARFQRADLVRQGDTVGAFRVTPLGYPAVRKYLQSRGYPVDGF